MRPPLDPSRSPSPVRTASASGGVWASRNTSSCRRNASSSALQSRRIEVRRYLTPVSPTLSPVEHLRYELEGSVARVTIDRPDAGNSLTPDMRDSLTDLF